MSTPCVGVRCHCILLVNDVNKILQTPRWLNDDYLHPVRAKVSGHVLCDVSLFLTTSLHHKPPPSLS